VILRPYAFISNGEFQMGAEFVLDEGRIVEVRPQSGLPDDYILSPAFVNVHSHLEYRGMQGRLEGGDFVEWIRRLIPVKAAQSAEEVAADCLVAAHENRATGVGWIGEHSDRVGAAAAMNAAGLRGRIFQEVITAGSMNDIDSKLDFVRGKAAHQTAILGDEVSLNPHATYSVDEGTLRSLSEKAAPLSIHAAESLYENQLIRHGAGPYAELERSLGLEPIALGMSVIEYLDQVGFLKPGNQLVHACDVSSSDLDLMAERGVSVAHCPRSNDYLGCPVAPVLEMVRRGIPVGLGLDSAASSGPVDFFAEMRSAVDASLRIGKALSPEQVWGMATTGGAASMGLGRWDLWPGSRAPLIAVEVPNVFSTEELIERGSPGVVRWITG